MVVAPATSVHVVGCFSLSLSLSLSLSFSLVTVLGVAADQVDVNFSVLDDEQLIDTYTYSKHLFCAK
jgi:hypothetical protein